MSQQEPWEVACAAVQVKRHTVLDCDSVSKMDSGGMFWKKRGTRRRGFLPSGLPAVATRCGALKVTQAPEALSTATVAPQPAWDYVFNVGRVPGNQPRIN